MRFGQIDATEAQVTMMMIMVITAIAGTGFWGIKVSVLNIIMKKFYLINSTISLEIPLIKILKFSGTRFPSIEILPTSVWNYLCFMELSANTE